ncbi:unnamed protein product [Peronospora farinosa]|uniref:Uncharacterized protein n=1 Tax=Peronospora farinosa TaxID=134698 RepID=A0AAV0TUT8_9STRA|nr:unnamed protein product [Peronospora farinosa]
MQKNLKQVDWLDGPTRQAAVEKIGTITNLIGYSTLAEHFPYELRGDALHAENICGIVMKHRYNRDIGRISGLLNRNDCTTMDVESPFFAFEYHLHATLLLLVVSSVTSSRMALITLEDTTLVTHLTGGVTTQQTSFDEAIQ